MKINKFMDYKLKKIYEELCKNSLSKDTSTATLPKIYEAVAKKSSGGLLSSKQSNVTYDNVIAKALFGDSSKIQDIPVPKGNYKLGGTYKVFPEDMKVYTALFPVTPPKADQDLETTSVGTKGSGNGEIALYWLLNKNYSVTDNRSAGKPDLSINVNGTEIGVEVKAYDSKTIGLGRFGDQKHNRSLLSIVFGLKALLSGLSPAGQTKRPPSLDTFNKEELINAFSILSIFDNNSQLREAASSKNFIPINEIYKQVDLVIRGLNLTSGKYTPEEGAAKMLLTFLSTKLSEKPGFGGYMANVKSNGDISYHKIPLQQELEKIDPVVILDNVNANGAALLIRPDSLFSDH